KPMDEVLAASGVGPTMVNRVKPVALDELQTLVREAVAAARAHLVAKRDEWTETNAEPLRRYRDQLRNFEQRSQLDELPAPLQHKRRDRVQATVAEQNDLLDRLETAGDPLLRVLALLVNTSESAA